MAMAAAVSDGQITISDIAHACLARIERDDPAIKAFVHVDPANVAAQAAALTVAAADKDTTAMPLLGVPVAVKDIIDTQDMPTEYGSPIFRGHRPSRDAAVVTRLRAAGAIIIGKTATTEFALSHPAATANPRDRRRTPGGSSSGSAAAVAAGMVPLAIGSQTSGSVLRPASFCGVYGYKPTFDAIPTEGVRELAKPLDHVGLFANRLDDIKLLAGVLSPDMPAAESGSGRQLRLAVMHTPVWDQATAEAQQALTDFAAAHPGIIEEIAFPEEFSDAASLQDCILMAHVALHFADLADAHPDLVSASLRGRIATGKRISATELLNAERRCRLLSARMDRLLEEFDAVLSLPAAGVAPIGLDWTGNPAFTTIWTMLGVPTLSMPVFSGQSGLPIGLQVIGRRHADRALLSAAGQVLTLFR